MLDNLEKIVIEKPVDQIISQIRHLISSGVLNTGDKLPPDRTLASEFGVSRASLKEALKKLEFYGILKILPQNGTFVANKGLAAQERLITDVLRLKPADFASLIETRVFLENAIAELAALRRTPEDIIVLQEALKNYEQKIALGKPAVEEDLLFHLKIADASKNITLKSLMLIITPDIVKNFIDLEVCDNKRFKKTVTEHQEIIDCIIRQDAIGARHAMSLHLSDVLEFSKSEIIK